MPENNQSLAMLEPPSEAAVQCSALLAEARETNRRLNRKLQSLQSEITSNRFYSMGFRDGYDRAIKDADARAEKRLAEYKHATRQEMARLRSANEKGQR